MPDIWGYAIPKGRTTNDLMENEKEKDPRAFQRVD